MAGNVVQWTVDQFWSQVQGLQAQITSVATSLQQDKLRLQSLYSTARAEAEPNRTHDMAMLAPLIHQNSDLRMTYLAPVKAKFNEGVNAARSLLKSAGYTPSNLSGLGIVPALVIVPAVAVAAIVVALAAVAIVNRLTQAQVNNTAAVAAAMADKTTTPQQKADLINGITKAAKAAKDANPPLFDPNALVMPLALVALIVLGPQLMRLLPGRRATA